MPFIVTFTISLNIITLSSFILTLITGILNTPLTNGGIFNERKTDSTGNKNNQ